LQGVETIEVGVWVLRVRKPDSQEPCPVVLMLHGWTGDENVMWVFASRLMKNTLLIAPRGLYTTPLGGYGWHDHKLGLWAGVMDFRPAVESLLDLLRPQNFEHADLGKIHLVGFSQGAALSFAFGLLNPGKTASIAALSGYFPQDAESFIARRPFTRLPVFLAHGTRDEIVPVEKARDAIVKLEQAGADVQYCEDDVGHKLSRACFNSLEHFHAQLS